MSLPSLTCFLYRMIKYKIKAEQILPVIPITKKKKIYPTNDMYFQATIINHSFFSYNLAFHHYIKRISPSSITPYL